MVKDEFERTEDRICFAQAALPNNHPLQRLYVFHSAAISSSEEFERRYKPKDGLDLDALRAYATDLEKAVAALDD